MKSFSIKILQIVFCSLQFFSANAANYYWVNGSGNWSNYAAHWATTSGGNVFHIQEPTSVDNVYFDANSFTTAGQTVTLNTTIVYCKDMDWTGVTNNPTLKAANTSIELNVAGSLILNAGMNFTFNGKLIFTALSGKTISTFDNTLACTFEFNGAGGEWTLTDSLTTTGEIFLTQGTFKTNNYNLTCFKFNSYNYNTRALYLGTSIVSITSSAIPNVLEWYVSGTLSLDADSSIIKFTNCGGFYSEGHEYNIIQWDSSADYLYILRCQGGKINKVISYNSFPYATLKITADTLVIDTIVSYGSIFLIATNCSFNYVFANHVAQLEAIFLEPKGNNFNKMTVNDYISFQGGDNYIKKLSANGISIEPSQIVPWLRTNIQTFDTCIISGDAYIRSDSNHFGVLTLASGKVFTMEANTIQYLDSLIVPALPGYPIQLVSSDSILTATLVFESRLCTDNLYIQGIHATGPYPLYAGANSIDVANNMGWIFETCITDACLMDVVAVPAYSTIMKGDSLQIDALLFNHSLNVNYQWTPTISLDCADCASVVATPDVSTTYELVVTDSSGCADSTSVSIVVLPTAISYAIPNNIFLYPNPTNGTIALKGIPSLQEMESLSLKLYDALGRQVWKQSPASKDFANGVTIDLSSATEGIFFLNISTANGNKVMKVVKY